MSRNYPNETNECSLVECFCHDVQETPRIDPYEYLRTFKYAPPVCESAQPAEMTVPTFTEEWELAPRWATRTTEIESAEYWFLRGVRAGKAAATIAINSDGNKW